LAIGSKPLAAKGLKARKGQTLSEPFFINPRTMSYLQDSINQVLEGNCIEVMKCLPEACIDLVLTDPPYLVGYTPRDGRRVAGDDTDDWLIPAFAEISRVLKDGGFCISFYGWNRAEQFLSAWREAGLRPVSHFVAIKHYPSRQGFTRSQHEQAYLLAKGYPKASTATISDVLDWEYTGNRLHPTQKPLRTLLPLIAAFSKPHELVLDPFCGSGSALLAAKLLGRRYIGIEVDGQHCDTARQRLTRDELTSYGKP
jgi:adenine-specific DNA-methyltransferase